MLVSGVLNTFQLPEIRHRALYYPEFDRALRDLAGALRRLERQSEGEPGESTMILASELYQTGGHSRIAEDIADTVAFYRLPPVSTRDVVTVNWHTLPSTRET